MHQLPQHTCLGRGTSQLLSVGGSPVALLGCTEADMDFWCWRGRAAETAAEAEAVEARDPGMVRLSLPFWMEAWPRLALSKSGEFLLRFVLVERTLFCEEGRAGLCHGTPGFHWQGQSTCPRHLPGGLGVGKGRTSLLLLGARLSTGSISGLAGKARWAAKGSGLG